MLARRLDKESSARKYDDESSDLKQPARDVEETTLPAPRVLHHPKKQRVVEATSDISSTFHTERPTLPSHVSISTLTRPAESACITPLAGSKRRNTQLAAGSQDNSLNTPHDVDQTIQKRVKTNDLDWLLPNTKIRGRRDDPQLRRSIAKECARLRQAIEKQVDSLSSDRVTGRLSRTERLQAEHRAACVFLEKRVWRSVRSLLQSLERSPSVAALRESEELLQQLLRDYKNTAVRNWFFFVLVAPIFVYLTI